MRGSIYFRGPIVSLLVAGAVVALGAPLRAEEDVSTASTFNASLPPEFSAAAAQGMANLFNNCMNFAPQIQALGSALQGGPGAGAFDLNTPCPPGAVQSDSQSTPSCDAFMVNGAFNMTMVRAMAERLDAAIAAAQCKKMKFDMIKQQLSCLSNDADILAQQVNSLQAAYVQNMQKMQADVQQIKTVEAEREQQQKEVEGHLKGNEGTGETGLLTLKQNTLAMLQQMPQEILGLEDNPQFGRKQIENKRKILEENVQQRNMALTTECFKTRTSADYRCERGGPPVSAYEYVKCRYAQNQQLGADGIIEKDKTTEMKANAAAQGLASLLDQIVGDAPSQSKLPQDQSQAQAFMESPLNILSAADIEAQYGDQLERFNGKGLDIRQFVLRSMGNCFQRAEKQSKKERARANTDLGKAQFEIKQAEDQYRTQATTLLDKYAQQYSEGIRGLTGMNLPPDVSGCRNAKPEYLTNCLKDLQRNLQGLLSGNVPNSTMKMQIQAGQRTPAITFSCQGLDGCITTLQNVSRNLTTERNKLATMRKDYIVAANQNVDRFTKMMANMMSGKSQMLTNRIKMLNTALASLGVTGKGIDIKSVEAETLTPEEGDPPQLYKPPTNALKLIGGQMNPPMIDVSGDTFSSALEGMGQGVQDTERQMSQAQQQKTQLQSLVATCSTKPIRDAMAALQTDINDLGNCGTYQEFCGGGDRLAQLAGAVASLEPTSGVDPDTLASLRGGLTIDCSTPPAAPTAQASGTPVVVVATGQTGYQRGRCQQVFNQARSRVDRIRGMQNTAASRSGTIN